MIEGIEKLSLQPGDIIVVRHPETLAAIERIGNIVPFIVPLVFSPMGIEKLSRQDLLNLLEQTDQVRTPVAQPEEFTVPG